MARINIPRNPDALIQLAQAILAKHNQDGAASPLNGLDMAGMTSQTADANTHNQSAAQLYRQAEAATQNRDLALGAENAVKGTVNHFVRSVRDVLAGLNKGNEQKLGDWGFEVDQSTRSSGTPETTPAAK